MPRVNLDRLLYSNASEVKCRVHHLVINPFLWENDNFIRKEWENSFKGKVPKTGIGTDLTLSAD